MSMTKTDDAGNVHESHDGIHWKLIGRKPLTQAEVTAITHWGLVKAEMPRGMTDTAALVELRRLLRARHPMREEMAFQQEIVEKLKLVKGDDHPWPADDVLHMLANAADHLLGDHDCDAHGYEELLVCVERARELVKMMRQPIGGGALLAHEASLYEPPVGGVGIDHGTVPATVVHDLARELVKDIPEHQGPLTEHGERIAPIEGDLPCNEYDPAGSGAGVEDDGQPQCASCGHSKAAHEPEPDCRYCQGGGTMMGAVEDCPQCDGTGKAKPEPTEAEVYGALKDQLTAMEWGTLRDSALEGMVLIDDGPVLQRLADLELCEVEVDKDHGGEVTSSVYTATELGMAIVKYFEKPPEWQEQPGAREGINPLTGEVD